MGKSFGNSFDGNRETDAVTLSVDGDIESDQISVEINERAAAVAGVDRGIDLEPVLNIQVRIFRQGTAVFTAQDTF